MFAQFRTKSRCVAGLLWAASIGATNAAMIVNGGFETGDLTGWTLSNPSVWDAVCVAGSTIGASTCIANSGTNGMAFGKPDTVATLSQSIVTVPGSRYTVSFYLANDNPGGSQLESFAMTWDGTTVFSLPNPQASFAYSQRVILNLTATGASTVLTFEAQHDPFSWFLDDVSIADVPEPAALLLSGIGLAAIAGTRLLRKKA